MGKSNEEDIELSDYLDTYFNKNEKFVVDNIINISEKDGAKDHLVLILESPHRIELINKRPLMGSSGKSAANALGYDGTKALGEIASEGKDISIINLSTLPLDPDGVISNFGEEDNTKYKCYIEYFEDNPKVANAINSARKSSRKDIVAYFVKRNSDIVQKLQNPNKELDIYACGIFAGKVADGLFKDKKISFTKILHPSYSQWIETEETQNTIKFIDKHKKK
ncbi:hypothetical protein HB943_04385 [Listeria weihenstephanensis]|uniref:Uncharacterized protein n=2 Tax=Listeria weihenstephanensis TaxID=1006155 RepID=A0A841Z1V5_9LIST|nr:hypothetical protein [Listeria weihenstephanensis]